MGCKMWSLKAREIMLNAINDSLKGGAKLVFYVKTAPLFTVNMPPPVAAVEGGALVFNAAEGISDKNGTPTRATLVTSEDVELLDLPIPDVLELDPADIIEGSIVRIKKFIIQ